MISVMPTVSSRVPAPPARGWALGVAVLVSVLLHVGAWFWIQPPRVAARVTGTVKPMRINLHMRAPQAAPSPAPAPVPRAQAKAKSAPVAARPAEVQARPEPTPPYPLPAVTAAEPQAPAGAATPSNMLYVPAALADQPPAPLGDWVLADEPWPDGVSAVQVTLWIDAEGRIERTLLLGAAADDPRVQAGVARIADTPMQPARVGAGDVFSVMTVEIWPESQSGAPPAADLPLAPSSAASGR